ncbi:MAG TPA: amidohydrolase family protein [Candidatus Acidoferrum sp.]|nr:amidohydrolase family protein [Candidatus Acidoferrum sp.]
MKHIFAFVLVAVVCVVGLGPPAATQGAPKPHPPVIDMHLHALHAKGWPGGPSFICPGMDFAAYDPGTKWEPDHWWESCPNPLYPAATDEQLLREILAVMDRYNVVLAATSGPLEHVRRYRQAAPKRMLPGLNTAVGNLGAPDSLRQLVREGEVAILGEIAPQLEGISPDDEILEPYLAVAEELDIPVAIHVLSFQPYYLFPQNRAALNNPLLLEKILVRHPKLRVYVMHAGWPMLNEMISLLLIYPQVYVDLAGIDWMLPRKEFYRYLRSLVEAGFGKRIMFGSDASMWPQTIAIGIEAVESADFLTEAQKRDILYNNAARFLRLDEKGQPQNSPH